ncbi:transcription factor Opi1-domain-containing protein [Parasitella parasitica]|nr:transcription factor Opi1-domain-containing protein [Parasitella parasitica]
MTQQSSAMSITQLCRIDEAEDSNANVKSDEADTVATNNQEHFIRRLPLVHTAIKAYENSSSVVKYGAEMIESYTGPIYDKLGYDRKLKDVTSEDDETTAATTALARTSLYEHHQPLIHQRSTASNRRSSRSTSPHQPYTLQRPSNSSNSSSKSRWQQIVLHAGSAAGTTAAVISEESMKCLRYCLSWLQYAMQHIDQQMNLLRNFLVSLATGSSSSNTKKDAAIVDQNNSNTLANIKKEIVDTLRKVVEVVSKYAGSGLPEQAKASVRTFILQLPSRWAILNNTRQTSPANSPRLGPISADQEQKPLHETSIKLLDFGGESIEMLKSVSLIFSDTINRAELWIKRLKVVGVNSKAAAVAPPTMDTN